MFSFCGLLQRHKDNQKIFPRSTLWRESCSGPITKTPLYSLSMSVMKTLHLPLWACALTLVAAGCKPKTVATTEATKVVVTKAISERVVQPLRFNSLIYSNYDATIQPRVEGYLMSKNFTKGMPVEQGQVLFTIDSAPIRLEVESNRAALASAKVNLLEAQNNYQRAVPLAAIDAISQSALDQYKASYAAAEAAVDAAQSQLDNSLLLLGYTTIASPIEGIIDDSGATVGDLVGPSSTYSTLATISNTDQVGVHLQIPFARYLQSKQQGATYDNSGLLSNISLLLADGTTYPYKGEYAYTKRDVGDRTGSLIIVAGFPNPEGRLQIGESVTVVADVGSPEGVVMVPQRAVVQELGTAGVWTVNTQREAHFVVVELGRTFGDHWIIDRGLVGNELVVVEGIQKLRNGTKVTF